MQLPEFNHGRRPAQMRLSPGLASADESCGTGDGTAHVAGTETGITRYLVGRFSSNARGCWSQTCIGKLSIDLA